MEVFKSQAEESRIGIMKEGDKEERGRGEEGSVVGDEV